MEIHVSIERVTIRLVGEFSMDIFDRIAAGVAALAAGNSAAVATHVAEIDTHLKTVDDEVLGLQTDDTSGKARLDAIEAGLGKVADAINPPAATGGNPTPASGGGTSGSSSNPAAGSGSSGTSSAPADGSTTPDVGPGGTNPSPHASAPIPSSGVGSETTGQVDTPKTV